MFSVGRDFFRKFLPQWLHLYLFFTEKSRGVVELILDMRYSIGMDQQNIGVALFFTFMLGAGIGFYAAKFVF
jgi:hypothetical protein